jgi:hypothetical protein
MQGRGCKVADAGLLPGREWKGDAEMKVPYGRMLKTVGLGFVLVAAVHFAIPPSAAASCTCSTVSYATNTPPGTGTSCSSATSSLQSKIQDSEIAACAPYNFCHLQPIVITSPCQGTNGSYTVGGYQRYSCYIGTTCPNGY